MKKITEKEIIDMTPRSSAIGWHYEIRKDNIFSAVYAVYRATGKENKIKQFHNFEEELNWLKKYQ